MATHPSILACKIPWTMEPGIEPDVTEHTGSISKEEVWTWVGSKVERK